MARNSSIYPRTDKPPTAITETHQKQTQPHDRDPSRLDVRPTRPNMMYNRVKAITTRWWRGFIRHQSPAPTYPLKSSHPHAKTNSATDFWLCPLLSWILAVLLQLAISACSLFIGLKVHYRPPARAEPAYSVKTLQAITCSLNWPHYQHPTIVE